MSFRSENLEHQRRKRELRLRIGRLRRRIDGRLHAGRREGERLLSWRTYVTRYPAGAILFALGAGLAFSAGLSQRRMVRWMGLRMMRQSGRSFLRHLSQECVRIWAESEPGASRPRDDGGRDV